MATMELMWNFDIGNCCNGALVRLTHVNENASFRVFPSTLAKKLELVVVFSPFLPHREGLSSEMKNKPIY